MRSPSPDQFIALRARLHRFGAPWPRARSTVERYVGKPPRHRQVQGFRIVCPRNTVLYIKIVHRQNMAVPQKRRTTPGNRCRDRRPSGSAIISLASSSTAALNVARTPGSARSSHSNTIRDKQAAVGESGSDPPGAQSSGIVDGFLSVSPSSSSRWSRALPDLGREPPRRYGQRVCARRPVPVATNSGCSGPRPWSNKTLTSRLVDSSQEGTVVVVMSPRRLSP